MVNARFADKFYFFNISVSSLLLTSLGIPIGNLAYFPKSSKVFFSGYSKIFLLLRASIKLEVEPTMNQGIPRIRNGISKIAPITFGTSTMAVVIAHAPEG